MSMNVEGKNVSTLWQTTEKGMSVDQVKKLFPNVVVPSKPTAYRGGAAQERLRLEYQKIARESFDVSFIFDKDGLEQVNLEYKGRVSKVIFEKMEETLTVKYGSPISTKKTDMVGVTERTWISDKTNIVLIMASGDLFTPFLRIIYQTRLAEDASGL
jgi:hypothetical protein